MKTQTPTTTGEAVLLKKLARILRPITKAERRAAAKHKRELAKRKGKR